MLMVVIFEPLICLRNIMQNHLSDTKNMEEFEEIPLELPPLLEGYLGTGTVNTTLEEPLQGFFSEATPGCWSVDENPPDNEGRTSYEIKEGKPVILNIPYIGSSEDLLDKYLEIHCTVGSGEQVKPIKMDPSKVDDPGQDLHVFRTLNEAMVPEYFTGDDGHLKARIEGNKLPMPDQGFIKIPMKFRDVSSKHYGWMVTASLWEPSGLINEIMTVTQLFEVKILTHVKTEMRDNARKPNRLRERRGKRVSSGDSDGQQAIPKKNCRRILDNAKNDLAAEVIPLCTNTKRDQAIRRLNQIWAKKKALDEEERFLVQQLIGI